MDELKVIAWCLDAAGGVLREEGFRLLYAKNDELIEELWDTMGVLDIPRVGGDIKSGAPAAYLWFGTSEDDEEDKVSPYEAIANFGTVRLTIANPTAPAGCVLCHS